MKISALTATIFLAAIVPFATNAEPIGAPTVTTRVDVGMTAGVVRKLDDDQQKITLKHEALENLGMPPMTMVFRLANASLIEKVKVGDRVMFRAEQIGGTFVVTKLTREDAID